MVKYGTKTPDWDEWRDLKNALLKIHPSLKGQAKEQVGPACSTFNLELSKVLKKERLKGLQEIVDKHPDTPSEQQAKLLLKDR